MLVIIDTTLLLLQLLGTWVENLPLVTTDAPVAMILYLDNSLLRILLTLDGKVSCTRPPTMVIRSHTRTENLRDTTLLNRHQTLRGIIPHCRWFQEPDQVDICRTWILLTVVKGWTML